MSQVTSGSYGGYLARAEDLTRVAPFAAGWPLQSFLELGALPSAVPCARLHARQVLWEWGLAATSEATELLVFELVTNAMQAFRATTQHTPIRLWVVSDKMQVVVLVWDASPLTPVPVNLSEDAETAAACCWWRLSANSGEPIRSRQWKGKSYGPWYEPKTPC